MIYAFSHLKRFEIKCVKKSSNFKFQLSVEIILAIALPIVFLCLIGIIIMVIARYCHRKKMESLASTFGKKSNFHSII